MNTKTFNDILLKRLEKINNTLAAKSKEYAHGDERLHNFKTAARIKGETPAQALWGMAVKHLVSVDDLVQGRLEPTAKMVDEKVGDMINYLILLEAVLLEKEPTSQK